MTAGGGAWPARLPWFTGLSAAAVVAVNVAGILEIAAARRGVAEETARTARLETDARARSIESTLSATRADLAFLIGSPQFPGLEAALASPDPREARWRRLGAEGALLLFLRGHPELSHLLVRSAPGEPLVRAGRRGGVPVVWAASKSASADPSGTAPSAAPPRRVTGIFAFEAPPGRAPAAVSVEAHLDAAALLARGRAGAAPADACALRDQRGDLLASEIDAHAPAPAQAGGEEAPPAAPAPGDGLLTEASLVAEGWSAASPWRLICLKRESPAVALLGPLAARYRLTFGLNLAVMAIVLLLGTFAIQQAIRRERLEAISREEARVRELERQLFHSERLSTVGRLAAGMAHEINNPLEGMSNYLTLARDTAARGDAAAAVRHLDGLRAGLDRAAGVVRRMLAHADPAGAPRTLLDLGAVLRRTVEFVRERREFQGIEFALDLDEGRCLVLGDQVTLGQVFLNIVLNACEAQPRGGEVRVAARGGDGRVRVEVADRGPGVAPGEAGRIFEPFYSTKGSSGLGLSICYSIVRQHGGEISVEDRPGGGAVFKMTFPEVGGGDG